LLCLGLWLLVVDRFDVRPGGTFAAFGGLLVFCAIRGTSF
jgi:hypothetical protein